MNIGGPIVNLSKQVFMDSGFDITNDKNATMFNFNYGSPRSQEYYQSISPGQMTNQIPGSFQITRKDLLMKNVQESKYLYQFSQYNISDIQQNELPVPKSYQIPQQLEEFMMQEQNSNKNTTQQQYNDKWYIYKPTMSSKGRNIQLFQIINQIKDFNERLNATIQIYETQPLLYKNKKVDIRMLILITSVDPFIVYLYPEGLGRLAKDIYRVPTKQNMDKHSIHLTNTALTKNVIYETTKIKLSELFSYVSKQFLSRCMNPQNEDWEQWLLTFGDGMPMHFPCQKVQNDQQMLNLATQTQKSLNISQSFSESQSKYYRRLFVQQLQENVISAIKRTLILSYDSFLNSSLAVTQATYRYPKSFFSYYGVDILLNIYGQAKVLEINASPYLGSSTDATADKFKTDFLYEALNLIGVPAFMGESSQKLFIPTRNSTKVPEFARKHIFSYENEGQKIPPHEYVQRVLQQLHDEDSRRRSLIRLLPDAFADYFGAPTVLNEACNRNIRENAENLDQN